MLLAKGSSMQMERNFEFGSWYFVLNVLTKTPGCQKRTAQIVRHEKDCTKKTVCVFVGKIQVPQHRRNSTGAAATRRAHHSTHVKDMLLLADSNYITWSSNIPCCLLSRPSVSRLGNLCTFREKPKYDFGLPRVLVFMSLVIDTDHPCTQLTSGRDDVLPWIQVEQP